MQKVETMVVLAISRCRFVKGAVLLCHLLILRLNIMSSPIIGITPLWDEEKSSLWMLPGYMDGIKNSGGLPIMLPLTSDTAQIEEICRTVDGLLFTGGQDVFPGLYGCEQRDCCGPVCKERDDMEAALFVRASANRSLPILGICRGLQFINVMLGGTLYQDLHSEFRGNAGVEHQQKEPPDTLTHYVSIAGISPLYALFGEESIIVNSGHHQAICDLAPELECMACAEDGLIEAVFMPDRQFVWAVQWHPECTLLDPNSHLLFEAFTGACSKYSEHK